MQSVMTNYFTVIDQCCWLSDTNCTWLVKYSSPVLKSCPLGLQFGVSVFVTLLVW